MLIVRESKNFKKSFKKVSQHKNFKEEKFEYVIYTLSSGLELPRSFKDHELSGSMKSKRECHISPDILLIYKIEKDYIYLDLIDIGSHSNLF